MPRGKGVIHCDNPEHLSASVSERRHYMENDVNTEVSDMAAIRQRRRYSHPNKIPTNVLPVIVATTTVHS